MSQDWVADIAQMHTKFGVNKKVRELNQEQLRMFLDFRIKFLEEELNETREAANAEVIDAEEVVDGLIDLCVVAIGTLDAFNVDAYTAWDKVHVANMSKEVGVKPSRPNPLQLPDLIKPEGWTAPSHAGNHGLLAK